MVTRPDLNLRYIFIIVAKSQSELTKQTIETASEKLLMFDWPIRSIKDWLRLVTRL